LASQRVDTGEPVAAAAAKNPASAGARVVHLPLPDSEVALVAALGAGRADAREALFDRYGSDVERVLYRTLGPDSEIPDLLQDVFVVALTSLDQLRNAEALRSWLIGIAIRKARKLISKRSRWRFVQHLPGFSLPERPANTASAEVSDALRACYAILERMPADERLVFALRHLDGMELTTIATACEISLATVKRRLARGQQRFLALAERSEALVDFLQGGGFAP